MFLSEAFSFFFVFLLFYSNLLALRGLPLESSETFQLFKTCQFFSFDCNVYTQKHDSLR